MTEKSTPGQPIEDLGSEDLEEARLRQQAIGVKLRHIFDEVVNEPVPDEFLDILRRADSRASGEGGE
ncbi:NepR family anti-sigma factor [Brevundimonas sp.]|uniref:anti-sigma T factor NepR n=1 Tax=Brevundimonas sp. TaxID=1871086 RepID=UPI003514C895